MASVCWRDETAQLAPAWPCSGVVKQHTPWHPSAQVVHKVLNEAGCLEAPPPEQLPAGSFPGLPAYLDLMRACRATDPAARPGFGAIVERLQALLEAEAQRRAGGAPQQPEASPAVLAVRHPAAGRGAAYSAMLASLQQRQAAYKRSAAPPPAGAAVPGADLGKSDDSTPSDAAQGPAN